MKRLKLPSPANRRMRAAAEASISWLVPTQTSRKVAVERVESAWLNGYDAALRDVRKARGAQR